MPALHVTKIIRGAGKMLLKIYALQGSTLAIYERLYTAIYYAIKRK